MKTTNLVRAAWPVVLALVWTAAKAADRAPAAVDDWRAKLAAELPRLGHRNWIVVADSAYPLQAAPGVETIYTPADQLDVLRGVLAELAKARHVAPAILLDAELKYVPEAKAPGVDAYRAGLERLLAGKKVERVPHEQIIARLDEAGRTFRVLLIKTPLAIPYTTVFIPLECGYWDAAAEAELRRAMQAAEANK